MNVAFCNSNPAKPTSDHPVPGAAHSPGRDADVIALIREAGRTEPALATTYTDARHRADRTRIEVFTSWPPGTLREDLPTSVDIHAALCTIDVYTTLTIERGWSPDRVESWWTTTLARELLA
ncbi:hypothetical protein ACFWPX_13840 [Nocardia sp. NPDC058518]|uniref:hypothetical protein n=1 Tax=Nocardia sp. NPDC058518 TaxID=3346534 RepID=UPI0036585A76